MEYSVRTRALSSFVADMQSGKYDPRHKFQRREGQWSKKDQSLLIDSCLRSYPIDPIRTEMGENGAQYIFDGMQRSKTLQKFMENGFHLSRGLEPVFIEGVRCALSGKNYSQLNPVAREKLRNFEIQVYMFTGCTEYDIRNMYSRQNNGKPHNTVQKFSSLMSDDMGDAVYMLATKPFIQRALTDTQIVRSADNAVALKTMMLVLMGSDEVKGFGKADIARFITEYNYAVDSAKISLTGEVLDRLNAAFHGSEPVETQQSTLPPLIYAGYKVLREIEIPRLTS